MRQIVVMNKVRVFENLPSMGQILSRTEKYIESGTKMFVGDTETKTYDHDDLPVIPFTNKGKKYYILERELDPTPDAPARTDWNQERRTN